MVWIVVPGSHCGCLWQAVISSFLVNLIALLQRQQCQQATWIKPIHLLWTNLLGIGDLGRETLKMSSKVQVNVVYRLSDRYCAFRWFTTKKDGRTKEWCDPKCKRMCILEKCMSCSTYFIKNEISYNYTINSTKIKENRDSYLVMLLPWCPPNFHYLMLKLINPSKNSPIPESIFSTKRY